MRPLVSAAIEKGRGRTVDEPATPAPRGRTGLRDRGSDGILRACSRPDCKRPVHAKGLCRCHYKRSRTGADLAAPIRRNRWAPDDPRCIAPLCTRPQDKRGLCTMHYQRRRDGVPLDAPRRYTRTPPESGVRLKVTLRLDERARDAVARAAEHSGRSIVAVLREVIEGWAGVARRSAA